MIADVVAVVREATGKVVDVKTTQKRVPGYTTIDADPRCRPSRTRATGTACAIRISTPSTSKSAAGPRTTDAFSLPLGLRSLHHRRAHGFLLNGKPYVAARREQASGPPTQGLGHQQRGSGEDVAIMRELGCTGVRLAHYQHSDIHVRDVRQSRPGRLGGAGVRELHRHDARVRRERQASSFAS